MKSDLDIHCEFEFEAKQRISSFFQTIKFYFNPIITMNSRTQYPHPSISFHLMAI